VLDEDAVFEDGDLRAVPGLANHHDAIDSLSTCQEFGLGEDGSAASTGVTTLAATLTLGLEAY